MGASASRFRVVLTDESGPPERRATVQHLFESVIAAIEPSALTGAVSVTEPDRQVLLDTSIGDARYVLVRLPTDDGRGGRLAGACLSPREREVARMVAKGLTNKNIARVLDISLWTVSTHLRRIFAKLGVASRAAMVAQLLEEAQLIEQEGLWSGPASDACRLSVDATLPGAPVTHLG